MSDAEDIIHAAEKAERRGARREAIALLRKAVSVHPTARVWARLGSLYEEEEQFSAAEAAFRTAIRLDPELAPAHSGLARVLEETNRLAEAEGELRTSIELQPTATRLVLLGALLVRRGQLPNAIAAFRDALETEPENEEAMFNLAVLIRSETPLDAEALLRRAIAIDPIYGEAYRELAFTLAGSGKYAEAESLLQTALSLREDDRWALIYLAHTTWAQGRTSEAEKALQQAALVAPLWEVPHRLLSNFYRATGRDDRALTEYRIAVDLGHPSASDYFRLAELSAKMERADEARSWLRRTLEIEPRHQSARALLGELGER